MTTALRTLACAAALAWGAATAAQAATEIEWWHAMGGELGQKLVKVAEDFNASQADYVVKPVFKGTYPETMTGAIAAFRARQPPHIVQIFEVGTATFMAAKGAVYPVHQLMKDAGEPFDPKSYLTAVVGYYTDADGNMLSFPFNSSTPVLYYNRNAFTKAGLDPARAPATWPELAEAGRKLQAAGYPCGFTTQWPSWIQIENFSAWHDVPLGTRQNGIAGLDAVLSIDHPTTVKHVATLGEWQKTRLFDYGGRQGSASPKFYTQECPIFMASSAAYAGVKGNAKDFEFGVGMLPYWPDVQGAPQNSIIGGASLWVMRGHEAAEYKGVARFFSYLSSAEVQAAWHQSTGYLPITGAAYELGQRQGFYAANPWAEVGIRQMTREPPTDNSKGLRFGNFVQIRDVIEEELEAVFAGKKDAAAALQAAKARGDLLLREFEKANPS
jgi:sn-glycerol 3-phosphate transport system substrate-binding protein